MQITLKELKAVKNLGTQAVREVEIALNDLPKLTDKLKKQHLLSVAPLIGRAKQMRTTKAPKAVLKYDGAGRLIE